MEVGLLEGVIGSFALSGKPVPARGGRVESIREHLSILLNTRRGVVSHLPDYGLPDSTQVSMKQRDSIANFGRDIEATVRKYEPRLDQIRVNPIDYDSEAESGSIAGFKLGFLLEARFRTEDTRFHALFQASGRAEIEQARR